MYPLWDSIIAPILEAAGARRVVEIGALQGETTVKLLDLLGPEGEVHVIDPLPQFDPSEHERRFPGRYHFHRDISHEVLPTLPPVDAALVDGDHNWYTVHNELKMLAATASEAGAPLPVLFLHDVGWPYGRRDLYYAPERIPEEFRQPWARRGLRLRRSRGGRTALLERGGFNPKMNNALEEGGPRNGVLTALEDFVAEFDRELRMHVVPFYFGLAIVADHRLIAGRPELGEAIDRLDSPQVLRELLELSEELRIREMHWGQVAFYNWQDRLERSAERYLGLLRMQLDLAAEESDHLVACLETIRQEKVRGDLVHCGTAGGDAALLMRAFLKARQLGRSSFWLVTAPDTDQAANGTGALGPGELRKRFRRLRLLDDKVVFVADPLPAGLAEAPIERAALVRIAADADPDESLEAVYDKVTVGGFVVVDAAGGPSRRSAVERFLKRRGVAEPLEEVGSGSGIGWRKLG